jgi:small subunit ribosomal protein S8
MITDPIADMLTRIRNAIKARHPKVDVPASRLKTEIARILKDEGYILNYKVAEDGARKTIKIYLKYQANNKPVITRMDRVYVNHEQIPRVVGGLGVNILTTPKGLMSGREAQKQGVGGEILCQIS